MTDKRSARLARSHDRQEQILDLISHGATYQHAAQELELTLPSVVSHLKRAYDRMGARTAAHAVRRGFETGILVPGRSDVTGLRAENDHLRAELQRVYRALVQANTELATRPAGEAPLSHPFSDLLLRMVA